jgi:hypothetical protein
LPLWDKARRCSTKASVFLELAQRWNLELATPWGLITRFGPDQRDSTLDHVWATDSLAVEFHGDVELAESDHLAQAFSITDDIPQPHRAKIPREWNWALFDYGITKAIAVNLSFLFTITLTQDIDNVLTILIKQLRNIANLAIL